MWNESKATQSKTTTSPGCAVLGKVPPFAGGTSLLTVQGRRHACIIIEEFVVKRVGNLPKEIALQNPVSIAQSDSLEASTTTRGGTGGINCRRCPQRGIKSLVRPMSCTEHSLHSTTSMQSRSSSYESWSHAHAQAHMPMQPATIIAKYRQSMATCQSSGASMAEEPQIIAPRLNAAWRLVFSAVLESFSVLAFWPS